MKILLKFVLLCSVVVSNSQAVCSQWTAKKTGLLDKNLIDEASGLTASALQANKLIWSNDSGGDSALFATDANGKIVKSVKLSNFTNTDFEALSSGPCPDNQADACLYIGDIGDGIGWRSSFKVGIFKESDFWASSTIKPVKAIDFSYPGSSNNAEAMVVTPEGKILILTKADGASQVFSLDLTGKVVKLAQLDLSSIIGAARGKAARVTDASLSKDGDKLVVLTYGDILEVNLSSLTGVPTSNWTRGVDFTIAKGPNLPQQETIAYTSEKSFIVSTESPDNNIPEIHTYNCK